MNNYIKETLKASLEGREKEILDYQVNIDNFTLMIEEIGEDADLQDFKANLVDLLSSSKFEQKKAKLIYKVIAGQLGVKDEIST